MRSLAQVIEKCGMERPDPDYSIIVWNSLAIWDALSAYIIHTTNPWPEFFMINLVGSSMFFAAGAMHLAIIILACRQDVRERLIG